MESSAGSDLEELDDVVEVVEEEEDLDESRISSQKSKPLSKTSQLVLDAGEESGSDADDDEVVQPISLKRKKPSTLTAINVDDNSAADDADIFGIEFPEIPEDFVDQWRFSADKKAEFVKKLSQNHKNINRLFHPDLPDVLVVKDDPEFVYQQFAMQSRDFLFKYRRSQHLLEIDVPNPDGGAEDDSDAFSDAEDDDGSDLSDSDAGEVLRKPKTKKGVDLFSLRDEDLEGLDAKLAALDENSDFDDEEDLPRKKKTEEAPRPLRKPKTVVDDEFFNLEDMEEFADEEEAGADLDTDGDDEDGGNYKYSDFFEPDSKEKSKKTQKVRFEAQDEDESEGEDQDGPILFGEKPEESKPLTTHEKSKKRTEEVIEKLEAANLEPRSWEMSGEVAAAQRAENSILEKYIDVDFSKRLPPSNTQELSKKIEGIIMKRVRDKNYDDVVRKYRDDNEVIPYRNLTFDMTERKNLMDVYEDKYSKAQAGDDAEDVDPHVRQVEREMKDLFVKLDALSHYHFAPPAISQDVQIVKNAPSLRVEEVGPVAATAANEGLLAPEEVMKHIKAAPKSKDERTKQDKLQDRRRKKLKQRSMAAAGKMPKVGKEKKEEIRAMALAKKKSAKTGDFFSKLQEQTLQEIAAKNSGVAGNGLRKKKKTDAPASKFKA